MPGYVRPTIQNRGNALWGRGGRRVGALAATVACVLVAASGAAGSPAPSSASPPAGLVKALTSHLRAYIPDALLSAAQQDPTQSFDVILQGGRQEKPANFLAQACPPTGRESPRRRTCSRST